MRAVAVLALLPACAVAPADETGATAGAVESVAWAGADLDVYFIPGGPAAEDRLVAEIEGAASSIRVAMYNLTSDRIGWALVDAHRRGVAVDVLWDAKQMAKDYNTLDDELAAAGLPITAVTNDNHAYATVHDKLSVIDGAIVTLGSANWGTSALHDNDEALLVLRAPALAPVVDAELDEIARQVKRPRAGDVPGPVQLHFSPEDHLDGVVRGAIDAATARVYVAVFSLRLRSLSDALIRAHRRGVTVFVITDRKQADGTGEDERLRAAGIPVVTALNATSPFTAMHHKFAVVDDRVLVGAYNWTYAATAHNDEDLAVIDDAEVAAAFAGEMGRVWRRYGGAPALPLPTIDVAIEAHCDATAWGDQLVLVGDLPELGAWDPARGVRLDGAAWPRWTGTVALPAGARVRYKLVVLRADGRVDWERGDDREAVLPTDAPTAELAGAARL